MYKQHWPAKTVTEADDHLFCPLNHHPLHINDVYAAESWQGQNVVVGPFPSTRSRSGCRLATCPERRSPTSPPRSSHLAPVFHGDTLFCESEVLDVRPRSPSPTAGVVKVHTRVYKQDGAGGRVQARGAGAAQAAGLEAAPQSIPAAARSSPPAANRPGSAPVNGSVSSEPFRVLASSSYDCAEAAPAPPSASASTARARRRLLPCKGSWAA